MHTPYVLVSGPSSPLDLTLLDTARQCGRLLAERGWYVLTGGLGGAMAATAEGVDAGGGTAIALLPGTARADASSGHTIVLPTGLGEMRNALLVRAADAVLAIGGSWGTLSEVALAATTGVPVVAVGSGLSGLPGPEVRFAETPEAAVSLLSRALGLDTRRA